MATASVSVRRRIFLSEIFLNQPEQASVAGAEVENAVRVGWNNFQQGCFAFGAVRDGIGAFEVVAGVVWRRPEIDGRVGGHVPLPFCELERSIGKQGRLDPNE